MSKGKAGGREKGSSMAQAPPQPPPVREIVPGRFTENDWKELISDDADADEIATLIDGLVSSAWAILYQRAIERALWPYTSDWVRETVETIVEWQFLERDEGEKDIHLDPSWLKDEEPMPAQSDAWARGTVPKMKVKVSRRQTPQIESAEKQPSVNDQMDTSDEKPDSPVIQQTPSPPPRPISGRPHEMKRKERPRRLKQRRRVETVDDRSERVDQASETATQITALERKANDPLHASSSVLRSQRGRPPGKKDVVYDSKGNVIQAIQLNPSKFPSHRVNTRFAVLDASETGKSLRIGSHQLAPPSLSHKLPERKAMRFKEANRHRHSSQEAAPVATSLIDSISLSSGVVIREAGRMKHGEKLAEPMPHTRLPLQPVVPLDNKDVASTGFISSGLPVIRAVGSIPISITDRQPIPPITTSKQPQNVST